MGECSNAEGQQRYDTTCQCCILMNKVPIANRRNHGPDEEILVTSASLKFGATVLGITVGSDQLKINWLEQQLSTIGTDIYNILLCPPLQL
jgi:hypothetical protein